LKQIDILLYCSDTLRPQQVALGAISISNKESDGQGVISVTFKSRPMHWRNHQVHPGVVPPLVKSMSAVSHYLYSVAVLQIRRLRHWVLSRRSFKKLPRWSAHPCSSQHQKVIREYSNFTETIISDRVSSVQHVNCREDIAAAKQELFSTSEHWSQMRQSSWHPACRWRHGWLSGRRHWKGVKDTGGEVTSMCLHFRLPPFPQFADHFHPLHPDSAWLSSILTAAIMHALSSLRVTFVPSTLWQSISFSHSLYLFFTRREAMLCWVLGFTLIQGWATSPVGGAGYGKIKSLAGQSTGSIP